MMPGCQKCIQLLVPEDQRTVPWPHVYEYLEHMAREHGINMPRPKQEGAAFERWLPWEEPYRK